jgi:2-amino-4-hydroxy-6-hydroxymethyldihydropteridine diphosphokinase
MHLATVGVGANQGDRETTIREAFRWLLAQGGNLVKACSSLYETEPFGKTDQEWFLNCVVQIETARELLDFFRVLQEGEALFGRIRQERWGPRTLDLDLLFFDDVVYSDSELTVPHPGIPNRRFVLAPLCEIAPDLVHPSLGEKALVLLDRLVEPSRVVSLGRSPFPESC